MTEKTELRKLHLVCNAHIDPVWLWTWEEGLAETLSTFRIAASFCEKHEGFIFCHNESLLYQWVEEYDPGLFNRIRNLIAAGKWRIIGGWYLQPDCNLPSGESLVRQILVGRQYFHEKFGVEPETAVNFDPFGHSRGLVQILAKSGYTSYLFCRPDNDHLPLESDDFVWEGYDGSTILAHRSSEHYNSEKGKVAAKLEQWMATHPDPQGGLFLWGIGNHGGGPSETDLQELAQRMPNYAVGHLEGMWELKHSWPEEYFKWLGTMRDSLPTVESSLNPWAPGCYTSMQRVKKMHRELEDLYYQTEKMAVHAAMAGVVPYPAVQLRDALEDMLFCEFHDILPGSGIPEVEACALQRMGHGLEILSRLRTRAFFGLAEGEEPAAPGEFPILVYNPEPYDTVETLVVELQGAEPNFNPELFLLPELLDNEGATIPYQLEKESANIANDHRKRLVFTARLKASSMNRFSCFLREASIIDKPMSPVQEELDFDNGSCSIRINPGTGLIEQYRVDGTDYLRPGSGELLVMLDDADPWGMKVTSFRELAGSFHLLSPAETARFAGTGGPVHPVRIIEDGPIRTVVECLLRYNGSNAVIRYFIPKTGSELDMEIRIFWNEKDRMLKLAFPVNLPNPVAMGQVAYGIQDYPSEGEEAVAQKWIGIRSQTEDCAITFANRSSYGFDYSGGQLRLSLLRSPAYAGHPVGAGTPIVRQDRFTQRIDQGEHLFRFRINAGPVRERMLSAEKESRHLNLAPMALCCFPGKEKQQHPPAVLISNPAIRMAAMKMSEDGHQVILRLFETTGYPARAEVRMPALGLDTLLVFRPFEIKTLSADPAESSIIEVNLLES